MRRPALLLTALLLTLPSSAHAGERSFHGGCGFHTVNDALTGSGNVWSGVMYLYGVVVDADPAANPVALSYTCAVMVDGVRQPGADMTVPGLGAVAAAAPISFSAEETQVVEICEYVWFAGEPFTGACHRPSPEPPQIPPRPVGEMLELALAVVDEVYEPVSDQVEEHVDPVVCPYLATLAGDYGGVVTVDAEGDVDLFGGPFWLCPPYES